LQLRAQNWSMNACDVPLHWRSAAHLGHACESESVQLLVAGTVTFTVSEQSEAESESIRPWLMSL